MNGADSLVKSLLASGVDVCFANPGTSEMHFVAALDQNPEMRCILNLFEGGVTGAADGYYRMSDKVAATLLHLGPGFGNGWANLHNGRKSRSGIVNIVGDHATWHLQYETPLRSDVVGLAKTISHWVKYSENAESVAADGAAAVTAARQIPGQIATVILPADTAWEPASEVVVAAEPIKPERASDEAVKRAAEALRRGKAALLVGDRALYAGTLELAGQIVAKTGCELFTSFRNRRYTRGAGRVMAERLNFVNAVNAHSFAGLKEMVIVGTLSPASFFAYPGQASTPFAEDTNVMMLAEPTADLHGTMLALAEELDALDIAPALVAPFDPPALPTGAFDVVAIGEVLGALMPENGIVMDEAVTSGRSFWGSTERSAPHDWMPNTGGSIGQGLPNAVGAAVACPDRKVIALSGDGSAMYTIQSLWTMARENLDIVVIIFANKGYQVLRRELTRVGVQDPGPNAVNMLEMANPEIDWQAMAKGHGVASARVDDLMTFIDVYRQALAMKGPFLIEAVV